MLLRDCSRTACGTKAVPFRDGKYLRQVIAPALSAAALCAAVKARTTLGAVFLVEVTGSRPKCHFHLSGITPIAAPSEQLDHWCRRLIIGQGLKGALGRSPIKQ